MFAGQQSCDSAPCYLYLAGHEEEDLFKYGVSKHPDKRLEQLQYQGYMELEGFPIADAELCFQSDPLYRKTAEAIELLWPRDQERPFIGHRYHQYREVVKGGIGDLSQSLARFVRGFDWRDYIEGPTGFGKYPPNKA
jgi:hypothetical protein